MSTIKYKGILLNRVTALEMLHTSRYRIFQVFIRKQRSEVWYCLVLFHRTETPPLPPPPPPPKKKREKKKKKKERKKEEVSPEILDVKGKLSITTTCLKKFFFKSTKKLKFMYVLSTRHRKIADSYSYSKSVSRSFVLVVSGLKSPEMYCSNDSNGLISADLPNSVHIYQPLI